MMMKIRTPIAPITASRMMTPGKASSTSASRLVTRSTRRPCSAASSARVRPMPKATSTMTAEASSGSAPAREDPAQQVAAEWVGAEPVLARGQRQPVREVLLGDARRGATAAR